MRSAAQAAHPPSDVVLVLLDSGTVEQWPFLSPVPRTVLARLVEVVHAAGARTIGLDVFLDRRYPSLNTLDGGDERLRDAIRRADNVILAASAESGPAGLLVAPPEAYFADVASGIGVTDVSATDGTVREGVLTFQTSSGTLVPSLALAMFGHRQRLPLDSILESAEKTRILRLPGLPREYRKAPEKALVRTASARGPDSARRAPAAAHTEKAAAPSAPPSPRRDSPAVAHKADLHAEVLVLGAGPGGYTAAFRAADLGTKVVLVERWPTLGGVCGSGHVRPGLEEREPGRDRHHHERPDRDDAEPEDPAGPATAGCPDLGEQREQRPGPEVPALEDDPAVAVGRDEDAVVGVGEALVQHVAGGQREALGPEGEPAPPHQLDRAGRRAAIEPCTST